MGETVVTIGVSSLSNKKGRKTTVLVDTGATYTAICGRFLSSLGIKKVRRVTIEFANGKVEQRFVGDAFLEVEGIRVPNPVIFARSSDANVLGLITLESCGLAVDTVNRKLVKLRRIHHYANLRLI